MSFSGLGTQCHQWGQRRHKRALGCSETQTAPAPETAAPWSRLCPGIRAAYGCDGWVESAKKCTLEQRLCGLGSKIPPCTHPALPNLPVTRGKTRLNVHISWEMDPQELKAPDIDFQVAEVNVFLVAQAGPCLVHSAVCSQMSHAMELWGLRAINFP